MGNGKGRYRGGQLSRYCWKGAHVSQKDWMFSLSIAVSFS
uniref:Uncharacterized protein n=1 Tax=Anguilla anguilla TaxID=7936 RepID=A0A0E9P7G0_ANGAN